MLNLGALPLCSAAKCMQSKQGHGVTPGEGWGLKLTSDHANPVGS